MDYQQNSYDFTVDFECSDCGHENNGIEITMYCGGGSPNSAEIECEKCDYYNSVELNPEQYDFDDD